MHTHNTGTNILSSYTPLHWFSFYVCTLSPALISPRPDYTCLHTCRTSVTATIHLCTVLGHTTRLTPPLDTLLPPRRHSEPYHSLTPCHTCRSTATVSRRPHTARSLRHTAPAFVLTAPNLLLYSSATVHDFESSFCPFTIFSLLLLFTSLFG